MTTLANVLQHSNTTRPPTHAIVEKILFWIKLQISVCVRCHLNIIPLPNLAAVACLRLSLTKLLRLALALIHLDIVPLTPALVWLHSCTALLIALAHVQPLILSTILCFRVLAHASSQWECTPLIIFVYADSPSLWTKLTTLAIA